MAQKILAPHDTHQIRTPKVHMTRNCRHGNFFAQFQTKYYLYEYQSFKLSVTYMKTS